MAVQLDDSGVAVVGAGVVPDHDVHGDESGMQQLEEVAGEGPWPLEAASPGEVWPSAARAGCGYVLRAVATFEKTRGTMEGGRVGKLTAVSVGHGRSYSRMSLAASR